MEGNAAADLAEEVQQKLDLKDKEEPQKHPDVITPEYVSQLTRPTDKFLCKLSDNWP